MLRKAQLIKALRISHTLWSLYHISHIDKGGRGEERGGDLLSKITRLLLDEAAIVTLRIFSRLVRIVVVMMISLFAALGALATARSFANMSRNDEYGAEIYKNWEGWLFADEQLAITTRAVATETRSAASATYYI